VSESRISVAVGDKQEFRGRQYEATEIVDHTRADGEQTKLAIWAGRCLTCNAPFSVKLSAYRTTFNPALGCPQHRGAKFTAAARASETPKAKAKSKKKKLKREAGDTERTPRDALKASRIAVTIAERELATAIKNLRFRKAVAEKAEQNAARTVAAQRQAEQERLEGQRRAEIATKRADAAQTRVLRSVFD